MEMFIRLAIGNRENARPAQFSVDEHAQPIRSPRRFRRIAQPRFFFRRRPSRRQTGCQPAHLQRQRSEFALRRHRAHRRVFARAQIAHPLRHRKHRAAHAPAQCQQCDRNDQHGLNRDAGQRAPPHRSDLRIDISGLVKNRQYGHRLAVISRRVSPRVSTSRVSSNLVQRNGGDVQSRAGRIAPQELFGISPVFDGLHRRIGSGANPPIQSARDRDQMAGWIVHRSSGNAFAVLDPIGKVLQFAIGALRQQRFRRFRQALCQRQRMPLQIDLKSIAFGMRLVERKPQRHRRHAEDKGKAEPQSQAHRTTSCNSSTDPQLTDFVSRNREPGNLYRLLENRTATKRDVGWDVGCGMWGRQSWRQAGFSAGFLGPTFETKHSTTGVSNETQSSPDKPSRPRAAPPPQTGGHKT